MLSYIIKYYPKHGNHLCVMLCHPSALLCDPCTMFCYPFLTCCDQCHIFCDPYVSCCCLRFMFVLLICHLILFVFYVLLFDCHSCLLGVKRRLHESEYRFREHAKSRAIAYKQSNVQTYIWRNSAKSTVNLGNAKTFDLQQRRCTLFTELFFWVFYGILHRCVPRSCKTPYSAEHWRHVPETCQTTRGCSWLAAFINTW